MDLEVLAYLWEQKPWDNKERGDPRRKFWGMTILNEEYKGRAGRMYEKGAVRN